MRLDWRDLETSRADRADGKSVELTGIPLVMLRVGSADHFLMRAAVRAACRPIDRRVSKLLPTMR